jgi:hypothetical protein
MIWLLGKATHTVGELVGGLGAWFLAARPLATLRA